MKLNIDKTKVIKFSRKTNILIYEYKLFHSTIARTDSVKDLGVYLDTKLYFHNHTKKKGKAIPVTGHEGP
jgi:hypothetical protein